MITSADNPRVKEVLRLRKGRERRRGGLFIAEGPREVERARAAGCGSARPTSRPRCSTGATGEEVSERVLAQDGLPRRAGGRDRASSRRRSASCRATRRSTSSRSGSRSRATSARWRARRTPPAPTRSSSPRRNSDPVEPERDPRVDRRRLHAAGRRGDASTTSRRSRTEDRRGRRRRAARYTDADFTGPTAILVGAEDDGLDDALARRSPTWRSRSRCDGTSADSLNAAPPPRSCSSRRCASVATRRRRPATTSTARARPSATASPRTPMLSSRTLGARLKCELFQRTGSFKAARRAEQAQQPHAREEKEPRRDRDLRRQPRAGDGVRRGRPRASTRSS